MESTLINSILKRKWSEHHDGYAVKFDDSTHTSYRQYFFLKRELDVTIEGWLAAKRVGMIRHCKIYCGKFLDYVVGKEFKTIEEWVADAGGRMEDVLYGENRVQNGRVRTWDPVTRTNSYSPYKAKYVELNTLLNKLGYVPPPQPVEVPAEVVAPEVPEVDITEILTRYMYNRGDTINNVFVLNGGAIVSWKKFVSQ